MTREHLFASLYEELFALEERIAKLEKTLDRIFQQNELCRRLSAIEGVDPVIATAVIAAIADGRFRNGWQFAAWIGLEPRQHFSDEVFRCVVSFRPNVISTLEVTFDDHAEKTVVNIFFRARRYESRL